MSPLRQWSLQTGCTRSPTEVGSPSLGTIRCEAMPGVPDGFWGNYLTFCAPEIGEFVVIDLLLSARD